MKKISCLTFALATGIVVSLTTGIESANAGTAQTFLVPFTGVVQNTCYTQTTASSSTAHEQSMCDTYQESSSVTATIRASQENTKANSSIQESPSALSTSSVTTSQFTTVVR